MNGHSPLSSRTLSVNCPTSAWQEALTGKYRPGKSVESMRAGGMGSYQNERGWARLSKIDDLAEKY